MVSVEGLVPVRHITKTFASGKTEKIVYQALADVGLPSGKADLITIESFTFDKFYKIYQTICPRNDIDELFRTINGGHQVSCGWWRSGPVASILTSDWLSPGPHRVRQAGGLPQRQAEGPEAERDSVPALQRGSRHGDCHAVRELIYISKYLRKYYNVSDY